MFKILLKVKKIKSRIVFVSLNSYNGQPSKWSAINCKYFNEIYNYNDLMRLMIW